VARTSVHFGDHQFKVAMLQKIPWTHVLIYQFILAQSGIQQVASAGSVLKVVNLIKCKKDRQEGKVP